MENWELEKNKSSEDADLDDPGRRHSVNTENTDSSDPVNKSGSWDENAGHRRFSDWQQHKKSMSSVISTQSSVQSQQAEVIAAGDDDDNNTNENDVAAALLLDRRISEQSTSTGRSGLTLEAITNALNKEAALENRECFSEDVIRVWNQISQFIIQRLTDGYGVQIPGLCTITIQEEKRLIPDSKYFHLIRSPIMILSRQVVYMYKLFNMDEYTYHHKVQSVPLHLNEIANSLQLPRRIVEGVVTEVLQAFARAVVCGKKVEFPFPSIGKLQVQNRSARMKFYEQFCRKMELELPKSNPATLAEILKHPLASVFKDELDKYQLKQYYEDIENEDSTIAGHMTPLRKHIPSETYRSVFHLREVRSVHDGELLVAMSMKRRGEKEKVVNEKEKSVANIEDHLNANVNNEDFREMPKPNLKLSLTEYNEEDLLEELEEDEGEEGIGELEGEAEEMGRPRFLTDEEVIETFRNLEQPSTLHPHDLHFGIIKEIGEPVEPITSATNVPKTKSSLKHDHRQSLRHTPSGRMKPKPFEAKPLYEKPATTGKYDIDLINSNKSLFKEALQAHHNSLTTQILGVQTVKEHYARRDLLRNPPMSYDDKRFNLPSPK